MVKGTEKMNPCIRPLNLPSITSNLPLTPLPPTLALARTNPHLKSYKALTTQTHRLLARHALSRPVWQRKKKRRWVCWRLRVGGGRGFGKAWGI